ncbi:MAG: hypothetical protein WC497_02500 [Patescibacteria group bacterium]
MKKQVVLWSVVIMAAITVGAWLYLDGRNNQNDNATIINNNRNNYTIADFETKTLTDYNVTLRIPTGSDMVPQTVSGSSWQITIMTHPAIGDLEYDLTKNIPRDATSLESYMEQIISDDYRSSLKNITFHSLPGYRIEKLSGVGVYISTIFQDNQGDKYNFYIEQTAPSTPTGSISTFTADDLENVRDTYSTILESISVNE